MPYEIVRLANERTCSIPVGTGTGTGTGQRSSWSKNSATRAAHWQLVHAATACIIAVWRSLFLRMVATRKK